MKKVGLLVMILMLASSYAMYFEDSDFASTDGLIYAEIQNNISVETVHAGADYIYFNFTEPQYLYNISYERYLGFYNDSTMKEVNFTVANMNHSLGCIWALEDLEVLDNSNICSGYKYVKNSTQDFYNISYYGFSNLTINYTSYLNMELILNNSAVAYFNYDGRKDLRVENNSINLTVPASPNNFFKNGTDKSVRILTDDSYTFSALSSTDYEIGSNYHEFNVLSGWSILPQTWVDGYNLSTLANLTGATITAYYNTSNQSFISHVAGLNTNAGYNVSQGESFFAYLSSDSLLNITDDSSNSTYNFSTRGWYLQYPKDESGLTLGNINSSLNSNLLNITAWAYFNNTNKKSVPAIYAFNISYDFTIPYLHSYWMYVNRTFEVTR